MVIMKSFLVVHDAVKTGTLTNARTGAGTYIHIYESVRRHIAENWCLRAQAYYVRQTNA